jgi:maltodextrin utilization protein YvdJ
LVNNPAITLLRQVITYVGQENVGTICQFEAFREDLVVRGPVQIAVSLVCLLVILMCVRYALGRERLRYADLHAQYQQLNHDYFADELEDAQVEWGHLNDALAMTYVGDAGGTRIVLDVDSNTSDSDVLESLQHESCHVQTLQLVQSTQQDSHGPLFQKCMERFGGNP